MKKNEFKNIILLLQSNFNNVNIETKQQFDFWYKLLEDIDYKTMQLAVAKLCLEYRYNSPKLADLRKVALEIMNYNNDYTAIDGWVEVMGAVKKYGIYKAKEAINNMRPLTRKVVNYMGFSNICRSEQPDILRAQFTKIFEQLKERENKDKLLPRNLKKAIEEHTKKKEPLQLQKITKDEHVTKLTEKIDTEGNKANICKIIKILEKKEEAGSAKT